MLHPFPTLPPLLEALLTPDSPLRVTLRVWTTPLLVRWTPPLVFSLL